MSTSFVIVIDDKKELIAKKSDEGLFYWSMEDRETLKLLPNEAIIEKLEGKLINGELFTAEVRDSKIKTVGDIRKIIERQNKILTSDDLYFCMNCGVIPSLSCINGIFCLSCDCKTKKNEDIQKLISEWNIDNKPNLDALISTFQKKDIEDLKWTMSLPEKQVDLGGLLVPKKIKGVEIQSEIFDELSTLGKPKKHKTLFALARNKMLEKPDFNPEEQIIEEMAELTQAISKLKRKNSIENYKNFKEELSDVLFCIFCIMFKRSITKKSLFRIAKKKTKKRFPEELK